MIKEFLSFLQRVFYAIHTGLPDDLYKFFPVPVEGHKIFKSPDFVVVNGKDLFVKIDVFVKLDRINSAYQFINLEGEDQCVILLDNSCSSPWLTAP